MKSLIVPIAIIVGLIAFSVIVDRENFSRYAEQLIAQNEWSASSKKAVPTAVPAVSAEDEEKHSSETEELTIEGKDNKEYETFFFEGTIRATSTIPDPAKNDYDSCLYALFVEIDSLLEDVQSDSKIASEVIVNVPIMKEKHILQNNIFKPSDKIWCSCAEYDAMPQDIREIQVSDDIQSYEHQQYYSLEIKKISEFQKDGNRNFAKRKITILPIQTLPKEEKAVALRKERIQNEIARIEEEIKKHGGSFESWKEEYKPVMEKYKQLSSENYKVWINDSFFATGGGETGYKTKQYIEGILPYKKYLEENNIDLIIVRIPTKWDFARCVLASDSFQDNPVWMEHYYECLKNDIEIVDPMPEMWKRRLDFPLFYYYHIPSEGHPFEGQAFISAQILSDVLKRYSFPVSDRPVEIEDYVYKTTNAKYFYPEGNTKFNPKDNIKFKRVVQKGDTIGKLVVNSGSPFLFLSNSYFANPLRSQGASVPGYTAYFLQHIPDWFYQDGIGNPMIRNLISDHNALSNRKVVVMVGHPNDWNKTFPPFPKYILDDAKIIIQEKTLDFLSPDVSNLDDGSFVFSKDEDKITHFSKNSEKDSASISFSVELSIPKVKEKSICMLRINFGVISYLTISVNDFESKELLDTTALPGGKNQHVDFCIPVLDDSRKILIEFRPSTPEKDYSIKNIELWYY